MSWQVPENTFIYYISVKCLIRLTNSLITNTFCTWSSLGHRGTRHKSFSQNFFCQNKQACYGPSWTLCTRKMNRDGWKTWCAVSASYSTSFSIRRNHGLCVDIPVLLVAFCFPADFWLLEDRRSCLTYLCIFPNTSGMVLQVIITQQTFIKYELVGIKRSMQIHGIVDRWYLVLLL